MVRQLLCLCLAVCAAGSMAPAAADRFVERVGLPDGQSLVVAEGDDESTAGGSYTVRLYVADSARSGDAAPRYASGIILARDGAIEDVALADLDGKGREQLVVVVRTAGATGSRSAQAIAFKDKRVEARSHVENLPDDADPVAALTRTTRSDKLLRKGTYHDPNAGAR
jgi:Periplasmic lysozyme inhibitor of I-type lysozyme